MRIIYRVVSATSLAIALAFLAPTGAFSAEQAKALTLPGR